MRKFNTLDAMMREVEELETLEKGWDSYGGLPPTRAAIDAINSLILDLEDGRVFAMNDGGAYICFDNLEFRADKDGKIEVRITLEDVHTYQPKSEDGKTWVYGKFTSWRTNINSGLGKS